MRVTLLHTLAFALLLGAALAFSGCRPKVVRDAHTYRQELRFLETSSTRVAGKLLEVARARAVAGDAAGCVELAKDALVVQARTPYHVAQALANADLGPAPVATPPPIPTPETWCSPPGGAP